MGGTYSAQGVHDECTQNIGLKSLKARDHSEDLGVDVKMISKWILEKNVGVCLDWVDLHQDKHR